MKASQVVIAVAIVLGVAAVLALGVQEASDSGSAARKGEPAPGFVMERYKGGQVSLDELRGKVVMIDFWATWCAPCKEEMPALVRLAREYEPRGVAFVAANQAEDPQTRKAAVGVFIAQTEPALAQYVAYADDETTRQYGIDVLPTLVLIDREGKIAAVHRGMMNESQLRRRLDEVVR